jgi:hypothetical protein
MEDLIVKFIFCYNPSGYNFNLLFTIAAYILHAIGVLYGIN